MWAVIFRTVAQQVLTRGLGGSRTRAVIGITAFRVVQSLLRDRPEVLYRQVLQPGDAIQLTASAPKNGAK